MLTAAVWVLWVQLTVTCVPAICTAPPARAPLHGTYRTQQECLEALAQRARDPLVHEWQGVRMTTTFTLWCALQEGQV